MTHLREFLAAQFSVSNILGRLAWMALVAVVVRTWVWLSGIPLTGSKEMGFWLIVPLSVFAVLGAIAYATRGLPELKGSIDTLVVCSLGDKPNEAAIFVIASIRNTGMDSIADNWLLTVRPQGGRSIIATNIEIPDGLPLKLEHREMILRKQDALYEKTVEQPIPKGGQVRGILLFQLEGVRRETVTAPGTRFDLEFHGVFGSKSTAKTVMTERSESPRYLPGMQGRFDPLREPPGPSSAPRT
jgi:hypothetical protein